MTFSRSLAHRWVVPQTSRASVGVIVQAGSVVHGKIPALSIAGGNPAKPFAVRDAGHYNALKQKGAYKW